LTPSISVILSTHDRPESLRAAVGAVLAGSLPPRELIVVNDGSAELDPAIAAAARAAGVRFRGCRSGRASLPASRNRGLDLASGQVCLFLDDDVILEKDYLRRLAELYGADRRGAVAGIGGVPTKRLYRTPAGRIWAALAAAFAVNRWGPRVCAARYVRLPRSLRGRLIPARRLSGGCISLRRAVARANRFEEAFDGYALGEDTELCFRVGRRHALFLAPELTARHDSAPGGRPEMRERGRMYLANMLHVARHGAEPGVGTSALLASHLAGMALLHLGAAMLSLRRKNLEFVMGMVGELSRRAAAGVRRAMCAS